MLSHPAVNDGGATASKKTEAAKPDAWSLAPESSTLPTTAMQKQAAGHPAPTVTNGKKQQSLLSWLSAQHSAPGAPSQSVGAATPAPLAPPAAGGGESKADSVPCHSPEEPAPTASVVPASTDDCASNDTVAASPDALVPGAIKAPGVAAECATGGGADLAAAASGAIATTTAIIMSSSPPPPCTLLESTSDSSCSPALSLPFDGDSGDVDTNNHSGGGGLSSLGAGGGGVGHVEGEAHATLVGGGTIAMNVDEEEKKTE